EPRRSLSRRALLFLAALAVPGTLGAAPWIVIDEIHYHPSGGDDDEFVEIYSREPPRADLTGWSLRGGGEDTVPPGVALRPRDYLVIARDPAGFRKRWSPPGRVLGPFTGKLGNSGGRVVLRNAAGAVVSSVRYGTRGSWPVSADGAGHTLSLVDP